MGVSCCDYLPLLSGTGGLDLLAWLAELRLVKVFPAAGPLKCDPVMPGVVTETGGTKA